MTSTRTFGTHSSAGYALLSVTAIIASLLVGAAATITMTRSELFQSAQEVGHQKAFYVAEAGIQRGLAELEQDRAAAAASTTYSYSLSNQSFGDGSYSITIGQDPVNASDASRKLIQSTGLVGSQQSVVVSHAVVRSGLFNDPDADGDGDGDEPFPGICPILFSDSGTARIINNGVATTLFDGDIFSNGNVELNSFANVRPMANGTVRARGNFVESGLLNLLANMNATLLRQGGFVKGPLHFHLMVLNTGVHFSNGGGYGTQQTITSVPLPLPDYESIKKNADTVVVNADNVPFGSWDSVTNTWLVNVTFSIPALAQHTYYVEGNASLNGVQLFREATATIVTRGWLAVENLTVLNTDLLNGSADRQRLALIGEEDVYLGRQVISTNPLTVEAEAAALGSTVTGLGLAAVEAGDRNEVFVHSEKGEAWVKGGTVNAASQLRTCILGKQDATLAFTAGLLSTVRPLDS